MSTSSPVCPTPTKRSWETKAKAKKHLKRATLQGRSLLAAYRCDCGRWHVGHKRGSRKNLSSLPRASEA